MASIIGTGISAINAFKRQLETTGHNIANANTEGFSRQRVLLGTRPPQQSSIGHIGTGVDVLAIERSYNEHLANQVRDYRSAHTESAVYEQRARQIDGVIADASAGIDQVLQNFFAAANDVADDPTSIPARSVMLNRAEQVSDRFAALDSWFGDIRGQLNRDMANQVDGINAIAKSLAGINARIGAMNGSAGGIPNDVLDERDRLIDDLSRITSVSTLPQADGSANVFIGTGQALVVGANYNTLAVTDNPEAADHKEIVISQTGGLVVNATQQMTGGSLGGLLRFRDEILDESHNALGRVAVGLGVFFNDEHRTGMDLDGELGGDFFGVAQPQVLANPTNGAGSAILVAIDDVAGLTTHEYRLSFDGAAWSLLDQETGGLVTMNGAGTPASPFVADGISIVVNAGIAGDSYRLRPTRQGAAGLNLLVTNERDIAAAEVVRSSANAANAGTGTIGPGAMTTRSGNTLLAAQAPPFIALSYQAGNQLAITGGPAGAQFVDASGGPLGTTATFNPGAGYRIEIPSLGVFDFTMTGSPQVGDGFRLDDNAGGVGDNRNARRLADLQTRDLMMGGTASIAATFGALVADVGTRTQQASNNASVQENLLVQAEAAKSEVSGVNLDEEAADLVRFQQAYQAAAQVISVANSLFDSLLGAVRR